VEDAEVVTAFHIGDATAFQILFDRHATHVYRTAILIVLDGERAEDIVQDTFLTLFQRLPRLAPGPMGPWLDRVAVNLSLNERRRTRNVPPRSQEETAGIGSAPAVSSWPSADVLLMAAEERAFIWTTLMTLTPRQRAMVVLRFYGDCTFDEIATTLGCRAGTVRATIHQALRHLRQRMAPRQAALAE
jgi:RNA polymerase sigma factor (sigma-70 family)